MYIAGLSVQLCDIVSTVFCKLLFIVHSKWALSIVLSRKFWSADNFSPGTEIFGPPDQF